ncbi:MAG: hypothetical protein ACT4QF_06795 [Sporichthyaceae bacterium]
MGFRVAAVLSLVLSGLALLVAGLRTFVNLVALTHPEAFQPPDGVAVYSPYSEGTLLLASAAITLAWILAVCLTAALLCLTDRARGIAVGRALLAAAGVLFVLGRGPLFPGGLTEATAAAVAMAVGAWAARRAPIRTSV